MDNTLTMFLAAIFGGFVGAFFSYIAIKNNQKQNIQMMEIYWNDDIRRINLKIDHLTKECVARNKSLYQELSSQSVEIPVNKQSNFSHGKPRD